MSTQNNINNLQRRAQFTLFITSYIPLFLLIIFKQFYTNYMFLNWGGFSLQNINSFLQKFGLSTILICIGIFGFWGGLNQLFQILKKLQKMASLLQ